MTENSNNALIADDFCLSNDFTIGEAKGQCWGVGHYKCTSCKFYRADFKANGQDYIDFAHTSQGGLQFGGINPLQQ